MVVVAEAAGSDEGCGSLEGVGFGVAPELEPLFGVLQFGRFSIHADPLLDVIKVGRADPLAPLGAVLAGFQQVGRKPFGLKRRGLGIDRDPTGVGSAVQEFLGLQNRVADFAGETVALGFVGAGEPDHLGGEGEGVVEDQLLFAGGIGLDGNASPHQLAVADDEGSGGPPGNQGSPLLVDFRDRAVQQAEFASIDGDGRPGDALGFAGGFHLQAEPLEGDPAGFDGDHVASLGFGFGSIACSALVATHLEPEDGGETVTGEDGDILVEFKVAQPPGAVAVDANGLAGHGGGDRLLELGEADDGLTIGQLEFFLVFAIEQAGDVASEIGFAQEEDGEAGVGEGLLVGIGPGGGPTAIFFLIFEESLGARGEPLGVAKFFESEEHAHAFHRPEEVAANSGTDAGGELPRALEPLGENLVVEEGFAGRSGSGAPLFLGFFLGLAKFPGPGDGEAEDTGTGHGGRGNLLGEFFVLGVAPATIFGLVSLEAAGDAPECRLDIDSDAGGDPQAENGELRAAVVAEALFGLGTRGGVAENLFRVQFGSGAGISPATGFELSGDEAGSEGADERFIAAVAHPLQEHDREGEVVGVLEFAGFFLDVFVARLDGGVGELDSIFDEGDGAERGDPDFVAGEVPAAIFFLAGLEVLDPLLAGSGDGLVFRGLGASAHGGESQEEADTDNQGEQAKQAHGNRSEMMAVRPPTRPYKLRVPAGEWLRPDQAERQCLQIGAVLQE